MDIRGAIKGQYHAGLAMLREAVELCPDDLWLGREHHWALWQIACHAPFFTDLYLQPNEAAFKPWKTAGGADVLPPEDEPAMTAPFTKQEMLGYLADLDARVDGTVDSLDLDTQEPGFHWYHMPKLDHQLMNLRHLQGHVGQLSEVLMAKGIDLDWVGRR